MGCGNIGRIIAEYIDRGEIDCKLTGVFDTSNETAQLLVKSMKHKPVVVDSIKELLNNSDIIIEAASQEAIENYALEILESGRNLMIMSVGATSDNRLFDQMKKTAKEKNSRIYIPSGGVGGIDGLNSGRMGKIHSVTLLTRKPPGIFGLEAAEMDKEKAVYEGSAKDAVKMFPQSVNVAATISLAGIGFKKTQVKIVADPSINENVHEIQVTGDFGELKMRARNLPCPDNPKTSYLAALSAIATLKKITEPVQIGN